MSWKLMAFVGAIYLVVAINELVHKRPGMAFVFFGYALSNVAMCFVL